MLWPRRAARRGHSFCRGRQRAAVSERAESGEAEAPLAFAPFAPGETPDIDVIEATEEIAAETPAIEPRRPAAPAAASASPTEEQQEEEISFAAVVEHMDMPDREEREAEDYGEDEDEEYEIPTTVVAEAKPSAIRFAEDVLPRRPEETEEPKKAAAKKARRAPRFIDEGDDEMDDIDYAGRIH